MQQPAQRLAYKNDIVALLLLEIIEQRLFSCCFTLMCCLYDPWRWLVWYAAGGIAGACT